MTAPLACPPGLQCWASAPPQSPPPPRGAASRFSAPPHIGDRPSWKSFRARVDHRDKGLLKCYP